MPKRLRITKRQLERILPEIQNSSLPDATKMALRELMFRASNPKSESTEQVVAGLAIERQGQVLQVAQSISTAQSSVMSRAKAGLMAISDDEWNAIVEESVPDDSPA